MLSILETGQECSFECLFEAVLDMHCEWPSFNRNQKSYLTPDRILYSARGGGLLSQRIAGFLLVCVCQDTLGHLLSTSKGLS